MSLSKNLPSVTALLIVLAVIIALLACVPVSYANNDGGLEGGGGGVALTIRATLGGALGSSLSQIQKAVVKAHPLEKIVLKLFSKAGKWLGTYRYMPNRHWRGVWTLIDSPK